MSIDVEKVWTDIEAMLETSQAKDARIAELERERDALKAELAARPVVEGEAARKLRSVWGKMSPIDRSWLCDYWDTNYSFEMGAALRAFCESAPPASAASDARARILTEQLNEQAVKYAAEGERWSREMDAELRKLRAELAELKDASEYVRAAVEYAEATARSFDGDGGARPDTGSTWGRFRALYDARKRGDASAAKVDPAPAEDRVTLYALLGSDGSVSDLLGTDRGVSLSPTGKLLAIDARVVEKGGAS